MRQLMLALALGWMCGNAGFAADWPQWRGPNRDGKSADTGLMRSWPPGGPQLRWKATEIGSGYSTPTVFEGRVFLQTTRGDEEYAMALDEATGREAWSVKIGKVGRNRGPNYPGTRSTPTIDGDLLYCLASDGELVCLQRATGQTKWARHMRDDFAGERGDWAYSESVLIDGEDLVCTPGGSEATLVKLNKTTGEVVWKAAVPDGDIADYASIRVLNAAGVRQYVQFLRKGVVGVATDTGKFLWRYDRTADRGANIMTPVVSDDRVFTAGGRSGGGLVRVERVDGAIQATEIYFDRGLRASIGGAVLLDGNLYGASGDVLFRADFATGQLKWRDRAVGNASICYADGRLYVREHNSGEVALVDPLADEYRETGRLQQPDRSETPAWPHPVVANGGLYLRDQGVLCCYDVAAGQ